MKVLMRTNNGSWWPIRVPMRKATYRKLLNEQVKSGQHHRLYSYATDIMLPNGNKLNLLHGEWVRTSPQNFNRIWKEALSGNV
jgi:hypothetical protein